jgi:proton-dependent oligopeptide transporter, POT family
MEGDSGAAAQVRDASGIGGHPRGLMTLYFTEMWERFSYYGMRAFLLYFMLAPVGEGGLGFNIPKATLVYGTYTMAVYILSIPGGFISDNFLGARRSVLCGGIAIAFGHFVLAMPFASSFAAGLALIVLGSGLLKPNISAMVGELYVKDDERRDAGFSIFYMGINLGALISPLVCGYLAQSVAFKEWLGSHGYNPNLSWHWGFAASGVGMTLGIAQYVLGRRKLARVGNAPAPGARPWNRLALIGAATAALVGAVIASDLVPALTWIRLLYLGIPLAAIVWFGLRKDPTAKRIAAILVFFAAATVFWAIYEQAASTIALFGADLTDRTLPNGGSLAVGGLHLSVGSPFPASFFQSVNSAFILVMAPAFGWMWLRLGSRQPSSPVKFVLGLVFVSLSFLLMVPASYMAVHGLVSPWWIVGLFFLQTAGELCISPVGLSLMTKLAPDDLVGFSLGIWFLASAYGNKLAGILAGGFTASDPVRLAHNFMVEASWTAVTAAVLLALVPWVRRLMCGVR